MLGRSVTSPEDESQVLLIASNFPPVVGGSANVYAQLAREARGRVRVLAASRSYHDDRQLDGWREYDAQQDYPVDRIPLLRTPLQTPQSGWRSSRTWRVAQELLLRWRLLVAVGRILLQNRIRCVCVGELIANGWLLRPLKYWPGIRTVVYIHGEELTTEDGYDDSGQRRRTFLRAADRVVAVSRFTADVVRTFVDDAARIAIIGNGVDFRRFSMADPSDTRHRLGWDDCFVFVSVCRLVPKKGLDQALRAFARLLSVHPEARYLLVGGGEDEARLRAIAAEESLGRNVEFAGLVSAEQLPGCYRAGDVFVMPNRRMENGDTEGFGLVFLEANAAGLPVIAGKDGGSVDAVTDGDNGLVVDGASVEQIHVAMHRLVLDARLRHRLAENGRRRAQENDWSTKARQFLQLCLDR
ncbi:MAG: glycosyltransferase family 4 protein [Acidihalobacter sp.]|uniref:glycosyltransferase family 4 protein n=1 Tax=Acidihalobacter sp. TaxID=1872108 RepID=UPI00307DA0DF